MDSNKVHVVVPARFGSSRLPGKPLMDINGKPMIQWVYESACHGYEDVIVATDDDRVKTVVEGFGGQVVMTSKAHESGTERLAEVANIKSWPVDDIIINWQGDEPALPHSCVEAVKDILEQNDSVDIATAVTPIASFQEFVSPDVVKAVLNRTDEALYFSRSPIPYPRDHVEQSYVPPRAFRHIGLYGYRVGAVLDMVDAEAEADSLEFCEKLEQLRALNCGMVIACAILEQGPPHGVDTPEDLEKMRKILG